MLCEISQVVREGEIPYDLPFNWNLINKEKSEQNITIDIEVENNLTIA